MAKDWSTLLNHSDHYIDFFGINILIKNKVFSPDPKITYSSSIVVEHIKDLYKKTVADVGAGTGAIAIFCALNGAKKVVATDISDTAIENMTYNIKNNNLNDLIEVYKTNLLEGVRYKFDIICANLPILDEVWEGVKIEPLSVIENFLKNAINSLRLGGSILIPWGSFAEKNRVNFERLIKKYHFDFSVTQKEKLGFVWYLYILKIKA
jgi:methylase of polypeptide subunit release factors